MQTLRIIDQHVDHHDALAGRWAYICLHVVALSFVVVLSLDTYTNFELASVAINVLALATVAMSLFLGIRGFCYSRLRQQTVPANEALAAAGANPRRQSSGRGLETLGRLAGGVAHDFNNSLMVLLNCIEILRTADNAMTRQSLLADMESAARGAQSTAAQLMSLSQDGATPGEPSDPRPALRSIASNLRRMLPENIEVHDHLRGTPLVTLVSGRFERVILTLCLDAKEAMPGGGELTIRCARDPILDEVVIEIEDTAAAEDHGGRTGYNDVLELVTESGGTLARRELEHGGTEVTLRLPVVAKEAGSETETARPRLPEKQRALLLDDNELVLGMLSTRLELAGYDITTATSVAEATRQFDGHHFDVLVCDAILPDGTPLGVIERFRETSSGPVVICSGYPQSDPLLAELKSAPAEFLQKPFSTDELLCRLSRTGVAA